MGPVNSWTGSTLQYVINSVSTVSVSVTPYGPCIILGPTSDCVINTLWGPVNSWTRSTLRYIVNSVTPYGPC